MLTNIQTCFFFLEISNFEKWHSYQFITCRLTSHYHIVILNSAAGYDKIQKRFDHKDTKSLNIPHTIERVPASWGSETIVECVIGSCFLISWCKRFNFDIYFSLSRGPLSTKNSTNFFLLPYILSNSSHRLNIELLQVALILGQQECFRGFINRQRRYKAEMATRICFLL